MKTPNAVLLLSEQSNFNSKFKTTQKTMLGYFNFGAFQLLLRSHFSKKNYAEAYKIYKINKP